jgi:hypothetical protein
MSALGVAVVTLTATESVNRPPLGETTGRVTAPPIWYFTSR